MRQLIFLESQEFEKKTSKSSASERKRKEAISEIRKIRNHRRTIARDDVLYLFHFISENEINYILMYFIETRQLGLELESARKDKLQTRSPTNYLYVL